MASGSPSRSKPRSDSSSSRVIIAPRLSAIVLQPAHTPPARTAANKSDESASTPRSGTDSPASSGRPRAPSSASVHSNPPIPPSALAALGQPLQNHRVIPAGATNTPGPNHDPSSSRSLGPLSAHPPAPLRAQSHPEPFAALTDSIEDSDYFFAPPSASQSLPGSPQPPSATLSALHDPQHPRHPQPHSAASEPSHAAHHRRHFRHKHKQSHGGSSSGWFSNGIRVALVNLKSRIRSMAHSGFRFLDSQLWLLGKCYDAFDVWLAQYGKKSSELSEEDRDRLRRQRADLIFQDFFSLVWMTYRRDFPRLEGSILTTDAGWGCMLRTAQMMMARAFICHYLSRDWRYNPNHPQPVVYGHVLRWFLDYPSALHFYSIHNLLFHGRVFEKRVGEWFGPAAACVMLKKAHDKQPMDEPRMLLCDDGVLYRDKLTRECTSRKSNKGAHADSPRVRSWDEEAQPAPPSDPNSPHESPASSALLGGSAAPDGDLSGSQTETKQTGPRADPDSETKAEAEPLWHAVIVLIPLRLGVDTVNPDYIPQLKECLKFPQTLGFVGGRTRQSLYFVGFQNDRMLYLDPHTVQRTPPSDVDLCRESPSFHCADIRSMSVGDLDPSLALGFYCRGRADAEQLLDRAAQLGKSHKHPLFTVADVAPSYSWDSDTDGEAEDRPRAAAAAAGTGAGPAAGPGAAAETGRAGLSGSQVISDVESIPADESDGKADLDPERLSVASSLSDSAPARRNPAQTRGSSSQHASLTHSPAMKSSVGGDFANLSLSAHSSPKMEPDASDISFDTSFELRHSSGESIRPHNGAAVRGMRLERDRDNHHAPRPAAQDPFADALSSSDTSVPSGSGLGAGAGSAPSRSPARSHRAPRHSRLSRGTSGDSDRGSSQGHEDSLEDDDEFVMI